MADNTQDSVLGGEGATDISALDQGMFQVTAIPHLDYHSHQVMQ